MTLPTTTSHHPPPPHPHPNNSPNDNVVDYYAIVGIGDTLEFQSSSSTSTNHTATTTTTTTTTTTGTPPVSTTYSDSTSTTTIDPNNNNNNNENHPNHINIDEMERFLREIIHIDWDLPVTTTTTKATNTHTNSTTNPTQQQTLRFDTQSLHHNKKKKKKNAQQFYLSYQRRRDVLNRNQRTTTTTSTCPSLHSPSTSSIVIETFQRFIQMESQLLLPNPQQQQQQQLILRPAIADLQVFLVRIHRDTLIIDDDDDEDDDDDDDVVAMHTSSLPVSDRTGNHSSNTTTPKRFPDVLWKRCTSSAVETSISIPSTSLLRKDQYHNHPQPSLSSQQQRRRRRIVNDSSHHKLVSLESYLTLPPNFHEWCIPSIFQQIYAPELVQSLDDDDDDDDVDDRHHNPNTIQPPPPLGIFPSIYHPKLIIIDRTTKVGVDVHSPYNNNCRDDDSYLYVPVIAVRRQSISNEQRYYEDAAITDIRIVTGHGENNNSSTNNNTHRNQYPQHSNTTGDDDHPPSHQEYDFDDDENDDSDTDDTINSGTYHILGQTKWSTISISSSLSSPSTPTIPIPTIQIRRNRPNGFCDMTFTTRVIGRFPFHNYDTVPLPMEELPMFCYPKLGCTLYRTQYSNIPLVQYYGFVVKNERGDSIYVSCVSFMEPLTTSKSNQLEQLSYQRRYTSLPHYYHYKQQQQQQKISNSNKDHECDFPSTHNKTSANSCLVTAFTDMTTFENKTICLVSRYPYWTAFRKFLSHLHMITTSSMPSPIPIERYISHLLLSVQLPRPGGPSTILPLPALNTPMILSLPHEKDLPLLDLPFHRLFSCLNIKTIVTIVIGLLSLERKVIIMSSRPSLVLDVAELLRSLLFPFELCAPYVPRLTEPFKSSLHFPGAIFVGIHDDGDLNGLAAMVKAEYPEESTIIDLDSGEMDCDGDRHEILPSLWNIIPSAPRTALMNELEALCRDADIVDGQEPLESLMDSAFHIDLTDAVDGNDINVDAKKSLDDRGIRDAFLRFFCSVMGGYERFLVVPDANFLISGDEWFDAPGFLASVPSGNMAYLTSLVSTQLFQSFIQRRTEASDIHCMLFDECMTEFHSSTVPYGRLGGDVEAIRSDESSHPQMLYSLLVDQSATLTNAGYDPTSLAINRSMDASEANSSFTMNMSRAVGSVAETSVMYFDSVVSYAGDLITLPSSQDLPPGRKYIYCVDGNPCFPHNLNPDLFLPREPSSWTITLTKNPDPLLARSERELEEANRRRRVAISQLGVTQRRCLWQLPKLFGSHFIGAWLLCTPALVSQAYLSHDQQSKYLLRALGALRLLRSKHRIVPDEAAYRALLVACGRTQSDRRVELVKLFGLLRSDGIFPSAVTLGQYTKALAEGYSKRLLDTYKPDENGVEVTALQHSLDLEESLNNLDTSLQALEYHGRRWQLRSVVERGMSTDNGDEGGIDAKLKRMDSRMWHPVVYSSSFIPCSLNRASHCSEPVRLVAIWSRTRCCTNCSYIPLEEEIQAGWDSFNGKNDIPAAVGCPRCDNPIVPMLAFRELTIDDALNIYTNPTQEISFSEPGSDFNELPPQISPLVDSETHDRGISYVTYINPALLREALEHYVEEYGDGILDRDQLRDLDLEVFVNFWWYCARFSLPLPLPTSINSAHLCAFAAWDRSTAERGCYSAAKAIQPLIRPSIFENDSNLGTASDDPSQKELFDDFPLLSRFNLQGFYSNVWDHPDLSKLLVSLVEACDKRDFRNVVESATRCNKRRVEAFANLADHTIDDSQYGTINSLVSFGGAAMQTVELDIYRVVLYLAKYQCTSAFHSFFPTTLKPCKGYHFWCAIGTPLPTFDRLFREAVRRTNNNTRDKSFSLAAQDLSDTALAFRCVFGHLI